MSFRNSVLTVSLAFSAVTLTASAQGNIGGSLRGSIADASGAALPNSTAVLTSAERGTTYKAAVDSKGQYVFSSVPPGTYALAISSPGFAEVRYDKVVIDLNAAKTLDAALKAGGSTEVVDVSTESEKIVTENTAVTGLFTESQIKDLPLNGRDYSNLVYLSPGITRSASSTGQGSGMVAAGTRATNNNFLIDGADNNDPVVPSGAAGGASGQIGAVPLDAIREFTVISSNPTAEFGRSSGAVINVVTKSGTNQVHGTLFEFFRNPVLNTRQYFDPLGSKTGLKQNDFGGQFGIPLWKDRTFMAAAYEGYRQRQKANSTLYLPTQQLIASITDPALRQLFQAVYPVVNGAAVTAANYQTVGFTSTVAKYTNNLDGDTGFVRFDHNFSPNHQIFLTGSILDGVYGAAQSSVVPGAGYGETLRPYHFVLSDTYTINAHMLNVARVAFQRAAYAFPGENPTTAMLAAGSARTAGPYAGQPYANDLASANGIPTVSSYYGLFSTIGVATNFPQGRASNVASYADALSIQKGKHELKFGFELRRIQENGYFSSNVRPGVTINDGTLLSTQQGAVISQTQYFYLTGSSDRGFRQLEQGYFAQDTWRATPRLTIELGARYEIFPAFSESKNLINNAFVMDANNHPNACQSLPLGAGMNTVALINPTNFGIKAFCTDYNNVAPRVGFSYDVSGKGNTTIRGAWGVFYDRIFDNVYGNSRFNAPQVAPITSNPTAFDGTQATGTISTTQVYTATVIDPHLRTPYTYHYNLAVSQQLDKDTSLTVGYVGAVGQKLFATERPNYGTTFPNSFRPTNQGVLTRSGTDVAAGIIRAPFGAFSYRTSNAASNFHSLEVNLQRRMSHGLSGGVAYTFAHSMDNISDEIAGGTDSANPQATYDNLLAPYLAPGSPCTTAQVSAATRVASTISSDATFLAAMQCATKNPTLTLAQAATQFTSSYTVFRPIGANYGDSAFDVRQRAAVNVNYELPFGRSRKYASNVNGITNQVIGGWNLSSVVDTQTGTPYIVTSGVDSNRDGDSNDRAVLTSVSSRNPALVKNNTTSTQVVSRYQCSTNAVDATTRSKTCTDGGGTITFNQGIGLIDPIFRLHRGALREPGIFNWDMGLRKNFPLHDQYNLRFSADAFNVLNRANFSTLGGTLTSSSFARSSSQRSINNTFSRQFQLALKVEF